MQTEVINYSEYKDYAPPQTIEENVEYFDDNWKIEGLPQDWYNFGKAGFSMRSQMNLLEGLDTDSLEVWLDRTEQDIRGFVVEYLEQDLVHPVFYRKEIQNGKTVLIDDVYEKEMVQTVSVEERNGSVVTSLSEIESHMKSEGSAAIMVSPRGWTGLTTDTGEAIEYPDSWIFNFLDHGDHVVGFGVKTDFSLEECRVAIGKLTGTLLPPSASVEEYVSAVAKIDPAVGISSPQDFLRVLKGLRNNKKVYGERGWDEVEEGINRLDDIMGLQDEAEKYIQEFRDSAAGSSSKFELQKKLAATLLLISALYLENVNLQITSDNVVYLSEFNYESPKSYGRILDEVERIPGCAGGGQKGSAIESIIDRLGVPEGFSLPEDKYGKREVKCPSCGEIVLRPKDTLVKECNHCGSNKISCK